MKTQYGKLSKSSYFCVAPKLNFGIKLKFVWTKIIKNSKHVTSRREKIKVLFKISVLKIQHLEFLKSFPKFKKLKKVQFLC